MAGSRRCSRPDSLDGEMGPVSVKVAVVGHVEWTQFVHAGHVPTAGEIVHARDAFEEPAGGGAVAAVQLARLAGGAVLVTALGDDEYGRRSLRRLQELGVEVWVHWLKVPTRRATVLVDDSKERTIVTLGARLEPSGEDPSLPWPRLSEMDAVYFTAGDRAALAAARAARVLVASPRAAHALDAEVELDALVLSHDDASEREQAARAEGKARLVVLTDGEKGGSYRSRDGDGGSWQPAEIEAETVDSYGCGDSFAAAFTYGLAVADSIAAALELAARCGAECATRAGPY